MEKNNTVDRRIYEALTGIDIKYIEEITDDYEIFDENEGFALGRSAKRKFYAKIAAAAACLVLVAGLMSAAPTIWNELKMIIPGMASSFDYDKEDEFVRNHLTGGEDYYGKYGECYVFASQGSLNALDEQTVGKYTFSFGTGSCIRVFYNNNEYDLKEAYDEGYISKTDLKEIYEYHTEIAVYGYYEPITPIELHDNYLNRIIYAYLKGEELQRYNFVFHCYGKQNGTFAVMIGNDVYTNNSEETVGGSKLLYGTTAEMLIYKEGKLYSVKEAYAKRIISRAFLEEIYNSYRKENAFLYGDTDTPPVIDSAIWSEQQFSKILSKRNKEESYIGLFGKGHVIISENGPKQSSEDLNVCGYDLSLKTEHRIWIYYNKVFYSPAEAFGYGILSEDDIGNIYANELIK